MSSSIKENPAVLFLKASCIKPSYYITEQKAVVVVLSSFSYNEEMQTSGYLERIATIVAVGSVLALPLFIAPISITFIEHSKNFVVILTALLGLLLFFGQSLEKKTTILSLHPITKPLFFLLVATLATSFFAQDYPVEALLENGGIFLAFTTIPIFLGSILPKNSGHLFLKALTGVSLAVVGLVLLQLIGFGPAQLMSSLLNTEFPTGLEFSVVGSAFMVAQLFFVVTAGLIAHSVATRTLPKWSAIVLPIFILAAIFFASTTLPGKPTAVQLPSYAASWSVLLDSLKSPKAALIGSGLAAYSSTYQTFRPLWLNSTTLWQNTFSQAANTPLTLFTTMGIFGGLSWILVLLSTIYSFKKAKREHIGLLSVVLAGFFLQVLLPFNTVIIGIQALALAFFIAEHKDQYPTLSIQALRTKITQPNSQQEAKKQTHLVTYTTAVLSMALVCVVGALFARATMANYSFLQATQKAAENDVAGAYTLQQKAISQNPYIDNYKTSYSQTNMLIAIALTNKADITEEEKAQVATLVQRALSEAQAATVLQPLKSQNWLNLAEICTRLIGTSEDASTWAVQSYVKAIETDPNNPVTRVRLANMLAQEKNFQQALSIYQQALSLKSDLPATYYNIAKTYIVIDTPEALQEARVMLQTTLSLLDQKSEDYTTVNKELEELEKIMEDRKIPLERVEEEAVEGQQPEVPQAQEPTGQTIETNEETSALGEELNIEPLPSITEQLIAPENSTE